MSTNVQVDWVSSTHPISDVRDWSLAHRLEMQPDFQRKEVWSKSAKIMLIDTILRNIPMPKIFLQAIIKGLNTYRIVIDGQQRLTAILGFLNDDYALDYPYEGSYASMRFSELPEEVQRHILSYKVDVNEIRNASKDMIRDIYSRVNKYTVQLNKQELRRADYPGDFLHLSEKLALDSFFDENRVFTASSSKRMGDVEYISELLMLLLNGPQEKKDELDAFYERYMKWDPVQKKAIVERFNAALKNIETVWPCDGVDGLLPPFFKSRFKQRADFYALFNVVADLSCKGYSLDGKDISYLRRDLAFLDAVIEPESEIQLFRKYAIQCVSQSNTIGSRKWRRNVLAAFLSGTYTNALPDAQTCRTFHNILIEAKLPFGKMTCPVCGRDHDSGSLSSHETKLGWEVDETCFQLSNARLVHRSCLINAGVRFQFVTAEYDTGDLGDDEFRTEE